MIVHSLLLLPMSVTCLNRPVHSKATLGDHSSLLLLPMSVACLNRPVHSKATLGDRSFSFPSSYVCNSFPIDARCADHCHHISVVY